MEVYKQGVELELNVYTANNFIERDEELHRQAYDIARSISSNVYWDDGKPEYPSQPHHNLSDLENELVSFITTMADKAYPLQLSLLGCFPYWDDFASGHIHTSAVNAENKSSLLKLRNLLYNMQPLIAYVSANSPLIRGQNLANDVRLYFSNWSRFTEFGDDSEDHYLSLALGRRHPTIECRIPSASPLYQILAAAIMIRSIIEHENDPAPFCNVKETFYNVIKYGDRALVSIDLPYRASYYGFKYKRIYVPITCFLKDWYYTYRDYVNSELSGCQSRNAVISFIEMLCEGYTVSNYILSLFYSNPAGFAESLNHLTVESYTRASLTIKPVRFNCSITNEPKLSFEELKQAIESIQVDSMVPDIILDILSIIPAINDVNDVRAALNANNALALGWSLRNRLVDLGVLDENFNVQNNEATAYLLQILDSLANRGLG